jgi:hypothetical protein
VPLPAKGRYDFLSWSMNAWSPKDDLVDAVQPPLPLLDDLRLERPAPVAGHLDADLAGALSQDLLRPAPGHQCLGHHGTVLPNTRLSGQCRNTFNYPDPGQGVPGSAASGLGPLAV